MSISLEQVLELCDTKASMKAIGDELGVTREYVRQILRKAGVDWHSQVARSSLTGPPCKRCGKTLSSTRYREVLREPRRCWQAGYCGSCFSKVELQCVNCGQRFLRRKRQVRKDRNRSKSDLVFHSAFCRSQWLGRNIGKFNLLEWNSRREVRDGERAGIR